MSKSLLTTILCTTVFSGFLSPIQAAETNTSTQPTLKVNMSQDAQSERRIWADRIAMEVINSYVPEVQYCAGVKIPASRVLPMAAGFTEARTTELENLHQQLLALAPMAPEDELLKREINHTISTVANYLEIYRLNKANGRLSLFVTAFYDAMDPFEYIFSQLNDLLIKGVDTAQVVERFAQYVQGSGDAPAFIDGAKDELTNLLHQYRKQGTPITPPRRQIEYITKQSRLDEIYQELDKLLPAGQKDLLVKFKEQAAGYVEFLNTELLPIAPEDTIMPREVYLTLLKLHGVTEDPHAMMDRAQADFEVWMERYKSIAKQIAEQRGYEDETPAAVMKRLTEETSLKNTDEIMDMYRRIQGEIEDIIRTNKLLTLPNHTTKIRAGTAAEEAIMPIPHVNTPPFVNADGTQWPEYVLCNVKENASPAGAYSLTAHEGNPGHVQQFSRMMELFLAGKMNLLETVTSDNAANCEGWAHYVEYMMTPYFTLEAQFGALSDQLMRIARMFLDPQVNLGISKYNEIVETMRDVIGFDATSAKSEADRYTFLWPGQATAYRTGALKFMDLRDKLQTKMGDKFTLQLFHDTLLSFGLLPIELVADLIEERMLSAAQ